MEIPTHLIDAVLAEIARGRPMSDCEVQAMLTPLPCFPHCDRPDVGGLAAIELAAFTGLDRFGRGRGMLDIHI